MVLESAHRGPLSGYTSRPAAAVWPCVLQHVLCHGDESVTHWAVQSLMCTAEMLPATPDVLGRQPCLRVLLLNAYTTCSYS
jgi:hypothetical protein